MTSVWATDALNFNSPTSVGVKHRRRKRHLLKCCGAHAEAGKTDVVVTTEVYSTAYNSRSFFLQAVGPTDASCDLHELHEVSKTAAPTLAPTHA